VLPCRAAHCGDRCIQALATFARTRVAHGSAARMPISCRCVSLLRLRAGDLVAARIHMRLAYVLAGAVLSSASGISKEERAHA